MFYPVEKARNAIYRMFYIRLCYNLFSVSVTTEHGKTVRFSKDSYQDLDEGKLDAVATKIG